MTLTLYVSPGACSLASHIALREAGAEFDLRIVDFKSSEQRTQDYLSLNPKGRVPALVTDRGVLTETPAILLWIAQTYPDAGLIPQAPWELAKVQELNSFICATLHVNHAHKMRGSRWADRAESHADMAAKVPETVAASFDHIERNVCQGPWVMGERFGIADAYLFTVARWIERDDIDPARFPKVIAHRERMEARPAVKAALEAEAG